MDFLLLNTNYSLLAFQYERFYTYNIPFTVETGTNHLVGDDFKTAENSVNEILSGKKKDGAIPPLWDGKASMRIIEILVKEFTS